MPSPRHTPPPQKSSPPEGRLLAALAVVVAIGLVGTAAGVWLDGRAVAGGSPIESSAPLGHAFLPLDEDRRDGADGAPVAIVEWLSPTCPHCAAFRTDVLPALLTGPVAKGTAVLTRRLWANHILDFEIVAVGRCLHDATRRDALVDAVLDGIPAATAGTPEEFKVKATALARAKEAAVGVDSAKAKACMEGAEGQAFTADYVAQQEAYAIRGTPTLLVGHRESSAEGGWTLDARFNGAASAEEILAAVDKAAKAAAPH